MTDVPVEPCKVCKQRAWWLRGQDYVCGVCHPAPPKRGKSDD
jgi:hypothetical protein